MFTGLVFSVPVYQLVREVKEVDWYQLGIFLGIKQYKLRELKQMYQHHGSDTIKAEMFDLWLKGNLDASWEALVTALIEMGERVVAGRVSEKYCGKPYIPGEGANFYMYTKYVYMLCTNIYLSYTGETTDSPMTSDDVQKTAALEEEKHTGMISFPA